MKQVLWLIVWLPLLGAAQGIRFEQGLSWEQIKQKAKTESKYIFIDCYATWCGPCKKMDKDIYPNDSVGNAMSDQFISVKIQMDTTAKDNEEVRKWWGTAHLLRQEYNIVALPTFLFFSPDGRAVDKGAGFKNVGDFLSMAANVTVPSKGYYVQLQKYRHGKLDFGEMSGLAIRARELHDDDLALRIARDYMQHYLDKLDERHFLEKAQREFLGTFPTMIRSRDRIFRLCFREPAKIDSIFTRAGWANSIVNDVITREEIKPRIDAAKAGGPDPDWGSIGKAIQRKYNADYADRNVTQAKIGWYEYKKQWQAYATSYVQFVNKYVIEDAKKNPGYSHYLNNSAFEVFLYSVSKDELEKALSWVSLAIEMDQRHSATDSSVMMDTKANILYKLGDRAAGTALEEKLAERSPNDKGILLTLEKMKKGEPTW